MKRFNAVFQYVEKKWIASCDELRITLEDGSFDALVIRIKVAIQEIAEPELGLKGNFELIISTVDRVEEIKAVG